MNALSFHFFWQGPLSNWHQSPFTGGLWDGVTRDFNTAEQWMMAAKALLFNDHKSLQAIMASAQPKQQKALGRAVTGFNKTTWERQAQNLVYAGCALKFEQSALLKKFLLNTHGLLVEASPYDQVWGIGIAESDPRATNPAQWLGTNWLGQVLTCVRNDLEDLAFMAEKRRLILHAAKHNLELPELFQQAKKPTVEL
jgi:ribA/ribD-fused uncharacterized protein